MSYSPLPPFAATSGAKRPKLVLVGEAWGKDEEPLRKPFVGESGKELWRMLGEALPLVAPELHAAAAAQHRWGSAWVKDREAWLEAAGIAFTNVLALRPPDNKVEALCGTKAEVGPEAASYPAISKGKYLHPQYLPELERLRAEIQEWKPNCVVALGNAACWALLRATNIGSIRGATTRSDLGVKVLATYHPSGVLRNWSWRPIVVADLMKAAREAEFPELRRPQRQVLINPTLAEIEAWVQTYEASPSPLLSCDIETEAKAIRMVGFATSRDRAIVIPFQDKSKPGWSYWPEHWQEAQAWGFVQRLLEHPSTRILGQNFLYDMQYLIPVKMNMRNMTEDTMLLHHSMFPELQKGLGFLGSIYTNESSWKLLRKRKADTEKRDE